jgi:hypothetical protein
MQKIRNEIHEIWIKVDLPSCFQASSSKLQIMLPKPNFVPKFPRTRQTKNLETWVKVRLSWTWQTTTQFLLFFFYCKLSLILSFIHLNYDKKKKIKIPPKLHWNYLNACNDQESSCSTSNWEEGSFPCWKLVFDFVS